MFQIFVTDLTISIFKRPSRVDRTQNMKKTKRDVVVAKKQYDEVFDDSMNSLLLEDS